MHIYTEAQRSEQGDHAKLGVHVVIMNVLHIIYISSDKRIVHSQHMVSSSIVQSKHMVFDTVNLPIGSTKTSLVADRLVEFRQKH